MAKSIMIQGTGSSVGKSLLVAGLCRAFAKRGLKVRPFKPQNMSNNAAVTDDGGEIGRAQALQARACRVAPHTDMNPILLKPESEKGAQIVVQGERWDSLTAREFAKVKHRLMPHILESYQRVALGADLVIVEGAGSPAEINLRAGDLANMGFAEAASVPVVLVGDIDRGGVIAQIVGTHTLLEGEDRDRIRGFLVNKFRGDVILFDEAAHDIAARTGWHNLGTVTWFDAASVFPAEDAMDIAGSRRAGAYKIAVPVFRRIANFDDLDPLKADPACSVQMVRAGQPLPGDADLILLPGSKSTIADLEFFRAQGWDIDLFAHVRRGGQVLGLCGGYQMLGKSIVDETGIEGPAGKYPGLGLLDLETHMQEKKHVRKVTGRHLATDTEISGYEIHKGETTGKDRERPFVEIDGRLEGAISADQRIMGCYMHGIFGSDHFRRAFLEARGHKGAEVSYDVQVEEALDRLALHLEKETELELIWDLAEEV